MEEHGYKSRLYNCWCHMKSRCYNSHNKDYNYYGGRGISVCEEWKYSYEAFREWALNNGYSNELTIDRIDTNGDYSPSNCRWVSREKQMNNVRINHLIKYQGKELTMAQWSKELGLPYGCLKQRINKQHWSIEKALSTPYQRTHQKVFGQGVSLVGKVFYLTYNNTNQTVAQWADLLGVNVSSLDRRINKGWSAEQCITTPFKKIKVEDKDVEWEG